MKKIIYIEFNAQDEDDTKKALAEAKRILEKGEKAILKPRANLILNSCLYLLLNDFYCNFDFTSTFEFIPR